MPVTSVVDHRCVEVEWLHRAFEWVRAKPLAEVGSLVTDDSTADAGGIAESVRDGSVDDAGRLGPAPPLSPRTAAGSARAPSRPG